MVFNTYEKSFLSTLNKSRLCILSPKRISSAKKDYKVISAAMSSHRHTLAQEEAGSPFLQRGTGRGGAETAVELCCKHSFPVGLSQGHKVGQVLPQTLWIPIKVN